MVRLVIQPQGLWRWKLDHLSPQLPLLRSFCFQHPLQVCAASFWHLSSCWHCSDCPHPAHHKLWRSRTQLTPVPSAPALAKSTQLHQCVMLPRKHRVLSRYSVTLHASKGFIACLQSKWLVNATSQRLFFGRAEAQNFSNPVLKYLPKGPAQEVTEAEDRAAQDPV